MHAVMVFWFWYHPVGHDLQPALPVWSWCHPVGQITQFVWCVDPCFHATGQILHDVLVCWSWYQPVGHTRQSLLLWESRSCQPTGQREQPLAMTPVVIELPRMAFQPASQLSQYDIPFWFCHMRWPHVLHDSWAT